MTTSPGAGEATARSLLPVAAERFTRLVHAVPDEAWPAPTPCTDWSVRDLVGHMTSEHLWVPPLLGGATLEDVGDRFDGDVLGDDPVAAWDAAITGSLRAWGMAREDQRVHLSAGPTPAAEYAEQMLLDFVVHAWDLARGAGLDDEPEPRLARHVLAYVEPHAAAWSASGVFAEAVSTERTDDAARLIAVTGRDPGWSARGGHGR